MTVRFQGAAGVELAGDISGVWSGPVVILLHGGGQTRHAWGATTSLLGDAGYLAVNIDLRGHGESDWAPDADYSFGAYAADLRAVVDQLGRPVCLVGASLGGLTSLVAAGEDPRVDCRALVLVDVTPRMSADGRERIGAFMQANKEGFASIEEAADAVSRYLPHRPRPADVSGLGRNLRLAEDGRYHWHWDPAFISGERTPRSDGDLAAYFEEVARRLTAPVLLVRGTRSELVGEEHAASFREHVPHAEYVEAAGAGHMVAGDRNDVFTMAVVDFLQRHVPPS